MQARIKRKRVWIRHAEGLSHDYDWVTFQFVIKLRGKWNLCFCPWSRQSSDVSFAWKSVVALCLPAEAALKVLPALMDWQSDVWGPASLCTFCILMSGRLFLFIFKSVSNSITDWRAAGFKTEVTRECLRVSSSKGLTFFTVGYFCDQQCQHICIKEDIFITHKEESQKASITAAKTAFF